MRRIIKNLIYDLELKKLARLNIVVGMFEIEELLQSIDEKINKNEPEMLGLYGPIFNNVFSNVVHVLHHYKNTLSNLLSYLYEDFEAIKIEDGEVYLKFKLHSYRALSTFGSGYNQIFYIFIYLFSNTDKIPIIHFLGSSLHPILQKSVMHAIIKVLKQTDQQLFVTTHAPSIVEGASEALKSAKLKKYLMVYRLERHTNGLTQIVDIDQKGLAIMIESNYSYM